MEPGREGLGSGSEVNTGQKGNTEVWPIPSLPKMAQIPEFNPGPTHAVMGSGVTWTA